MTKQPEEPTNQESRLFSAELELDWQDAYAQRYRAAQLFHSDEWDDASDDNGNENWDD
jgi:hypothetical protein